MSVLPLGIARVSELLQSQVLSQQIESAQSQLLTTQNQLSTGIAVSQPSDNPAAASIIIQLQQNLAWQQTYQDNINSANSQLSESDSSLSQVTSLLQQAQQIASTDVQTDVTASQRQSDAGIVQNLYNQILSVANQNFNGQYLFGGAGANTQPFVNNNGVVQFVGSGQTLNNTYNTGISSSFQVNGASVFGSLGTGVTGSANLTPDLTASTRVSDLGGATGEGVDLGSIQISDGTVAKTVNLASASSVGDIVNLINNAGVGSITASITGQGLTLAGTGAENISVSDLTGGTTAADLGIATAAAGAGVPDVGASVQPRITALTPVSKLNAGAGIDNSGLQITNGATTKTITWSPTATVQDVLNAINGAGLGVTAQINASGTGLNILNATQGVSLSIGENGGATATELGLSTFNASTLLSSLNNGTGVQTAGAATPDFSITAKNGTNYSVTLNGATTVQDVLNDINTATGGAVTATLATQGNGIVLTDTTGGGGTLAVTQLNDSTAATEIGIVQPASGNKISGTDSGAVQSQGIFGNLAALQAALQTGNIAGITSAAQGITSDVNRVIDTRGQAGAVQQALTNQQTQITQQNTATQTVLSQLQDINFAATASKFQTLQTALQASLETAAASQSLSLLNFVT